MSRTEAAFAKETISPDPSKPGIWLIPSQGGANLLFTVPLGYALYQHRYPLYNFSLQEMLETFPKMDTLAADAISIFGRYARRILHKLGISGVICFGFNHLIRGGDGKLLNFIAAGRIPHLSLFFSSPLEVMNRESVAEVASASSWRGVLLDREVLSEMRKNFPQGNWHYLPPATDPELYFPISGPEKEDLHFQVRFAYVGGWSDWSAELISVIPSGDLLIWGDPHWGNDERFKSAFRGSALRVGALNRIYNLARFVLVLDEYPALALQRALDVIAAGSIPVLRRGVGIEELFDGYDLPQVSSSSELGKIVALPEKEVSLLRKRVLALRQVVLQDHTWYQRVPELVKVLLS